MKKTLFIFIIMNVFILVWSVDIIINKTDGTSVSFNLDEIESIMFSGDGNGNLNEGLIGYYPFNGNANDESGNGHNGTVYGATLVEDRFGNPNSAYYFDGVNDYIRIPNSPDFDFYDEITISAWISAHAIYHDKTTPIITKWKTNDAYSGSWYMNLYPDSESNYMPKPYFTISYDGIGNNYSCMSTELIDFDRFYNLTAVYNHNEQIMRIYINGHELGTLSINQLPYVADSDILIGAMIYDVAYHVEKYFNGIIDDIRIYNRALSAGEIMKLYKLKN